MKKKMIILTASILVVCLVVVGFGGFFVYQAFTGPMYQPGMVRSEKGLGAPLDPPPQPGEEGVWLVEPDIRLHYFISGDGKPALVIHGGPGNPSLKPWTGWKG
jgi:proline iminopeptidase